jgi:hypothetical protein
LILYIQIIFIAVLKTISVFLRFEVLTVVSPGITVFWDVTPCSLIGTNVLKDLPASLFKAEK